MVRMAEVQCAAAVALFQKNPTGIDSTPGEIKLLFLYDW